MIAWLRIGDLEIARITEQTSPIRSALDAADDIVFQSFVVCSPHHIVLIDSCIGNDKDRPGRPRWQMNRTPTS